MKVRRIPRGIGLHECGATSGELHDNAHAVHATAGKLHPKQ